jgi:hypothetical protein
MTKRIHRWFVPVAAVAAVVVGGGAIASAQQPAQTPAPITKSAPSSEPVGGTDTDTIQSGDQTTPDTGAASATMHRTVAATAEAPGTEQSPASELTGAPEQPGSETAANDDGPGGHADEPGNPSADHQFEGVQ